MSKSRRKNRRARKSRAKPGVSIPVAGSQATEPAPLLPAVDKVRPVPGPAATGGGATRRWRPRRPRCGEQCGAILGLYAGLVLLGLLVWLPPRARSGFPPTEAPGRLAGPAARELPATRSPAERATAAVDGRQAVLAAVSTQLAKRAWRVRQTVSSDEGAYVQTVTHVAPDRYRVYQPGIMEVVAIGDRAWRRSGALWSEHPEVITATHMLATNVRQAPLLDEALTSDVVIESLGEDRVDGAPAQVYRYRVERDVAGSAVPTTVSWWIRTADGLPVRQLIEDSFAGRPTFTELKYSYGPALHVEPPPVPTATPGPSPTSPAPVTE